MRESIEELMQYTTIQLRDRLMLYKKFKLDASTLCSDLNSEQVVYRIHLDVTLHEDDLNKEVKDIYSEFLDKPLQRYVNDIHQYVNIIYGTQDVPICICPLDIDEKKIRYLGKHGVASVAAVSLGYVFYDDAKHDKTVGSKLVMDSVVYDTLKG